MASDSGRDNSSAKLGSEKRGRARAKAPEALGASSKPSGSPEASVHSPPMDSSRPETSPVVSEPEPGQKRASQRPESLQEEFLNRERSWLEFNRRVLHQALDERTPLLERLGFMAIFNSNLDEYYQKRIGGLKRQIEAGVQTRSVDGLSAEEQIEAIRAAVIPMLHTQARCFARELLPRLAEQGIHLLNSSQLTAAERAQADAYFRENLFPVLTPLAVDRGHPFPFISNLSMSLGVMLRPPGAAGEAESSSVGDQASAETATSGGEDPEIERLADQFDWHSQFARVKVPDAAVLPRWVRLDTDEFPGEARFIRIEQIIQQNLGLLFEGMQIDEVEPFRVSRNADVERDEEDAEDLLGLIEQELRDRRFAQAIRLEVDDSPSRPINRFLINALGLGPDDVYEMPGELDYTPLWEIHDLNRPELKHPPWTPIVPPRLVDVEADIFSIIRQGPVLVHHPYESFSASVQRFIREAARDPKVVAIKLTLYRTGSDSPFIPDLIKAAEAGKQVVVLVELKARFDEGRNVQLAQQLEKAGIHVVYGLVGYKTHTKTSLVVRSEPEGMRTYAHIGTGNYHAKTANLYTDLGILTCDPRLTGDLVKVFHYLTGRSIKHDFDHLLIAPINMRDRFLEMIDREIEHCPAWHSRGGDSEDPNRPRIIAKLNSLEDRKIIRRLYDASQNGVRIELIVRGFCCLRPGVPGMSENIHVSSVIGRFLEHSRIYRFHNAGTPEYFIGSADWMYRNLNSRVECITPIYEEAHQQRLWTILRIMLADRRQAWDMDSDGQYTQRQPDADSAHDEANLGTHRQLMRLACREAVVK